MYTAIAEDELADAEVPAAEFLAGRIIYGRGETKPGRPCRATMAIEIDAIVNGTIPFPFGELVKRHMFVADQKCVAQAIDDFAPANAFTIHADLKDSRGTSQPT